MKQPVDHILRPSLPWRDGQDGAITECGYDASRVTIITRDQYAKRLKDMGRQRTAMVTCMTCANTAERWAMWADDPRLALGREIEWEAGGGHYRARHDRGYRLLDELTAMAALVQAHREEFDAMVSQAQQRREWLKKKADHASRAQF